MTEQDIIAALTEMQTLAATAVAEAAGDSREGQSSVEERIAVMSVVRNRLRQPLRFGHTYREVCLAPAQFSCWTPGPDANHQRLIALAYLLVTHQPLLNAIADETLYLANGIISGVIADRTNGATSYYAPKAMKPAGRVPPWAMKNGKKIAPVAQVGDQLFFKGV